MYKKDTIPKNVKSIVWLNCMHNVDNRLAQCWTCSYFVRFPESLKHHFIKPHIELNYGSNIYIEGVGEFGHIISEFNGGLPNENNLVIQCKKCNTTLGKNNLLYNNKSDTVMLDSYIFNNYNESHEFMIEEYKCSHINTLTQKKCSLYRINGRDKCHIHINT